MLSAPADKPAMIEASFGVGFAAPDRTRSLVNQTCSSSNVDKPVCSASSITGTRPAQDTRFASSDAATPRCQSCDNLTESVLSTDANLVFSKPIFAGRRAPSSSHTPATTGSICGFRLRVIPRQLAEAGCLAIWLPIDNAAAH